MELVDAVAIVLWFSSREARSKIDCELLREAQEVLYTRIISLRVKKLANA